MNPARVIVARLAREGYGTVIELLAAPASLVLDLQEHAHFVDDYAATYAQLNKDAKT